MCIPNFPDRNLPAMLVYFEGKVKRQFIGPQEFSERISCDELEWLLAQTCDIKTDLEGNPLNRHVQDVLMTSLGATDRRDRESDEDDW